jgi:hypothetical protein
VQCHTAVLTTRERDGDGTKEGMVEIMCSLAAQRRIFFAADEAAIAISI